jgi:PhnB protein
MIQIVLYVKDVAETLRFYTDVMGFEQHGDPLPGPDGMPSFGAVTYQGFDVFVQKVADVQPIEPNFEIYLKLEGDANINSIYNEMRAKGAKLYLEIKDEFWGDRAFGVLDNNGFKWRVSKQVREVSEQEMIEASRAGQ